MTKALSAVTYLVRDYDEAIAWFSRALGFEVIEDVALSEAKRWVLVGLQDATTRLLLAKAEGPEQVAAVGHGAGGRGFRWRGEARRIISMRKANAREQKIYQGRLV